jgi:carboxylate-amine ligase
MSTLPELAAVAAFVQVLVEHFSRELDAGRELPTLQPWFLRENKWRAARYGLDAQVIADRAGAQHAVRAHIAEVAATLAPVAADLGCARELSGLHTILTEGSSSERQLRVADESAGDLRQVVRHLIGEFREGPTLHEHLARLDGR